MMSNLRHWRKVHRTLPLTMLMVVLIMLFNKEAVAELAPNLLEPKIEIQSSYDSLVLVDSFKNNSPHTIYLAPKGSLPAAIIHRQSGEELEEQWRPGFGLRKPYTLDEYQKIPPHATHKEIFELHKIFYFFFDCHDYTLVFYNGYFYPDNKDFHELGIMTLEFSWCNPVKHNIPKRPKRIELDPSIFKK